MHGIRPIGELVELAVAAEQAGASTLLIADEGVDRDIYVVLAAIATATERITLVPGITNPFSRHPVATAAALATLEELAPRRVVAGLGTGGSMVFGPMGFAPRRPFSALAESVDVVDALLAGHEVTHQGEFIANRARLPWSPRRLPIGIAGRGPKVQQLAALRADWVILAGKQISKVPELVAGVRARAAETRSAAPWIVWNPAAAWTESATCATRPRFSYITIDMPAADRAAFGISDETILELRHLLLTAGPEAAAHLIPDAVLEAHAIVGTRGAVVDRLRASIGAARPEVLVFEAHEYSTDFIGDVADLAAAAGLSGATHRILG